MSDGNDKMVRWEEQNWQDLAEKFIERNRDKAVISYEDFLFEQWEQYCADRDWEPDE